MLLAQGRLFVRCSPCAFLFISNLQKNEKQPRSPASGPTFAKRLTISSGRLKIKVISKEVPMLPGFAEAVTRVHRALVFFAVDTPTPIRVYCSWLGARRARSARQPASAERGRGFLLPFQRLTRSKHTADTEADTIFSKRLTIPPGKLKIQSISTEISRFVRVRLL